MIDVLMPQLGETITEGTITRWLKRPGDLIVEGESLFEVSTDKVDSEVPAPASGVLAEVLAAEGSVVLVNDPIARIGSAADSNSGETSAEVLSAPEAARPTPGDQEPAAETVQPVLPSLGWRIDPSPVARGSQLLSPRVARELRAAGADEATIVATGPRGRLTLRDVTVAVHPAGSVPPRPSAAVDVSHRATDVAIEPASGGVALSPMRRRIGAHMMRSKAVSPHAWITLDVDYSEVERARHEARDDFKQREGWSLTPLPFVGRAVIEAISKYPLVNASIRGDELVVHPTVNLGFAVDLSFEGLVVVVVRSAEGLRLRHLAREVATLADAARARSIAPDHISGSTFTISNVGSQGALAAMPIINQPELAILATGAIQRRPVVLNLPDGSEGIAVRPIGSLSLSWDHRGFDGAYAAEFLAHIKRALETRDWSSEVR